MIHRFIIGLLLTFLFGSIVCAAVPKEPLTIVYNRGIAPIKFTANSGEASGILNEYWQLLAEKADFNIKFVEVDSFTESLEMVKNGKADLHAGIFYTDERSRFLAYSKPVLDLKYYIYSSPDLPPFASLAETRGYLLGVVQGGYTENYIKKVIPQSHLLIYDDFSSLFEAVLAGEIKVFVASDIHLNYYLSAHKRANPFKHHGTPLYEQTYFGATAKANQPLIEKIIAAQKLLSKQDLKELRERWLSAKADDLVSPQIETLSAEEMSWIREHPVVRVANEMDWPPFDFNRDGQPLGLSIDLLNLIAARTGLKLEYKSGYLWNELQEMLRQKQLDIIHSLNYSAERAEYILFTKPYISNLSVIVTTANNNDIHDVADLHHKTIAVINGYNQQQVLQQLLQDATFITVESPLEALKAVSSGRADATVRFNGVAGYLINQHLLKNLKFVNEFKVAGGNLHELFLGVRNDWPMLQSILQKGLDSVTIDEMNGLKRKWISLDTPSPSVQIKLTEDERQWLQDHPKITLGSDYRWPPFDFVGQDGKHAGLSAEFVQLIAQRTGLTIDIKTGVWSDILTQMKNGELDGLACAVKTEERLSYLDFSRPYLGIPTAIVVKDDNHAINSLSDLNGKTVSINKGSYMHEWLASRYPEIKLHLSTSNEASVEAVSYGEVDAYIGNLAVADYIIRERLLTNLKVVKKLDDMLTETSVAIDKRQPLLLGIIQKALDSITASERQAILDKWYLPASEEKVALTEQEKAWMRDHPVVRVSGNPDWAPVSYRDKDGGYAGIAGEYLQRLAVKSDLKFETVPANNWDAAQQMMIEGNIEVLNAISKVGEHDDSVDFTDSFMQVDTVLITRDDIKFIKGLEDLDSHLLGTIKNFAVADYLQRDYPSVKLRQYINAAEGLKALSHGAIDVFAVDIPTFEYYSQKLFLANLKISGVTPYSFDVAIGVAKGNPELVSILNKSLKLLTREEKNAIYNNWVTLGKPLVDYSLLWKTVLGAAIFLLALFYWNRRLADEVLLRKKAEAMAQQASRSKSDFLANMSHEIRTPMNSVLGFAELLDNMITDPEQKNYLKSIRSGGKALLEIINDILDLSKIEAGKMVLKPVALSLEGLFVEIKDFFKARMNQKGLEFICRIDPEFPAYIMMDDTRFRQILINLIGNALKFTERGRVQLSCENVRLEEDAGHVDFTITVSDTGIGIPPEQQELIFNKFEQQQGLDTARYGGTGLGLSICKNLTDLMGGMIKLESVPGKGSVFQLSFSNVPITRNDHETEKQGMLSVAQFGEANVLIVDDRKDNRLLIQGYFKGSSVRCHEAENGKDALELLRREPMDMVLMDLRMPLMNGYETITEIRRDQTLERLPVIAFTASVMGDDMEKISQYGFDGYLRKPVSRQELFLVASGFLPLISGNLQQEAVLDQVNATPMQVGEFLRAVDGGLMARWQEVKDSGDFTLVEEFSAILNTLAQKHGITEIETYTQQLREHVSSFDIIEVDTMMNQFPEIISALEKQISGVGGGHEA